MTGGYGGGVKLPKSPHSWAISAKEAVAVQRRLAGEVVLEPLPPVRYVLGLDCAFAADTVLAVGVVWDMERRTIVESRGCRAALRFPYVPGLLSFRELPVLLDLSRRIRSPVDVVMCDGQGIAHPRRFGIAAHYGVVTGLPTVGCAKSRLWGRYETVGSNRGAWQPLVAEDGSGDVLGRVLCTRDGVKPVFVSPGHRCDVASAAELVLACGTGYRIPEPTRQADRRVAAFKRAGRYRGGMTAGSDSEAK
jgi:deoxyribonuclease V